MSITSLDAKKAEINVRRVEAYALHRFGLSWKDVGKRLGVSDSRAIQLARIGERIVRSWMEDKTQ